MLVFCSTTSPNRGENGAVHIVPRGAFGAAVLGSRRDPDCRPRGHLDERPRCIAEWRPHVGERGPAGDRVSKADRLWAFTPALSRAFWATTLPISLLM